MDPWSSGHPRHEIADELAKLGTQEDPVSRIIGVPFASRRKIIKSWLETLEGSQTADEMPPTQQS